jgi:hypothetical protein
LLALLFIVACSQAPAVQPVWTPAPPPCDLLCIGDSVRIGWAKYLACEQPKGNCRWSGNVKEHLAEWTRGRHFKDIVFNAGLWDVKKRVPLEDYKRNLNGIIDHLDAERLYFCTITPGRKGTGWEPVMVDEYNRAALEVMQERGVNVIDLYTLAMSHREWWQDDVHYTEAGYMEMARYIEQVIKRRLAPWI